MLKQVAFILILSAGLFSCGEPENLSKKTDVGPDTIAINYFDFPYHKAIAFVTIDPFDFTVQNYKGGKFSISLNDSIRDTISRTLDSSQIAFLNSILSHRKVLTKEEMEIQHMK